MRHGKTVFERLSGQWGKNFDLLIRREKLHKRCTFVAKKHVALIVLLTEQYVLKI